MDRIRARMLLSHALAAVGMSLPWPALLSSTWSVTADEALLGTVGMARMLPYVVCSWWVASLADRWGRRRVVGWTLTARLVLLAVASGALAWDAMAGLPWAVACCTLAVAAGTPAYPALVASMPTAGPGQARRASDLLVTIEVASFVVGPAIGGLLLGRLSAAHTALLAMSMTALAAVCLSGVSLPGPVVAGSSPVGSVARLLRASARVRGAIAAVCMVNFVGSAMVVALVVMAPQRWGGDGAYGMTTAAFGFGALGAPLLWWLGRSPVRRVHAGMTGFAVALVALVPIGALAGAVAVLSCAGALAVHVEAAATEVLQREVPDEVRAGVMGATDALMVCAALVGAGVGPLLLARAEPVGLLLGLALVTVVSGFVALPVVRESLAPAELDAESPRVSGTGRRAPVGA